MAVKFLTNLDLNGNQLLNARLQVLASDPGTALAGDIIYNSSTNVFKFYNGTSWIDPSLGGISGSGTVGSVPIFVTNTTTLGDSQLQTSGSGSTQLFTFNTLGVTAFKGDVEIAGDLSLDSIAGGGGLKDKDGDLGTSGQLLSSTGTATNWINAPVSYTKWVLTGDTGTQNIEDGNTVLIAGGTNITTAVTSTDTLTINGSTYTISASAGTAIGHDSQVNLTCNPGTNSDFYLDGTANEVEVSPAGIGTNAINIGLPTNVTIPGNLTVGGGDITLSGTGRIQGVDTVTAATDAANKAYVDSAVVGGFTVKGAFNANTGVIGGSPSPGNLTSGAGRVALAVGDFYVVAIAGNFFGNTATPLTPGDSVLVQTAALAGTSTESNFAIIQSDTDLATLTNVGIGNVNASAVDELLGIDVVYSTGTAKVGLDIDGLGAITTTNDASYLAIFDEDSSANKKIDVSDLGSAISSATSFAGSSLTGTTHTFNHNLGSFDVMVQTFDNSLSSADTLYASVERTSVNQVVVTTAASANIRCLIQKVG